MYIYIYKHIYIYRVADTKTHFLPCSMDYFERDITLIKKKSNPEITLIRQQFQYNKYPLNVV